MWENPRATLAGLLRELEFERARGREKRVKLIETQIRKVKKALGDDVETAVEAPAEKTASRSSAKGGD